MYLRLKHYKHISGDIMNTNLNKNKENIISAILVILGAFVYISLVLNNNVWLDEAFTASLVRTDMAGVLSRSMADTLPPLYNIILKLSTDIFGYTVPVMKLTSAVPMILAMVISATVVRKRFGFLVSTLLTLCLFTMPNLLFYGVEIRMYSLGFLFAFGSAVFSYECIKESNKFNWLAFTLFSVLAGYSHHFAFVSVGFVYLFLLLYYFFFERTNIKRWFLCLLATFILYFPCLVITLKQFKSVSGYFSMPEITLSVFIKYARFPYTVGNPVLSILLTLLMFILVIFNIVSIIKNPKDADLYYPLCLFISYYGVLIFGTLVSKVMTANIFVDRYLLFSSSFLWMFFSIEIAKLCNVIKGKFKYGYISIVIFVLLCGVVGYMKEYHIEYDTNPDNMLNTLDSKINDGDILYTIEDNEEMAFCLPFYYEGLTNYEELSDAIAAADSNNSALWLTIIDYDYKDYDFSELEKYNLKANEIGTFTFDRYEYKMYELTKYTNF